MPSQLSFQHFDLGHLKRGDVVEVTLRRSAANIELLDSTALSQFKRGKSYRSRGGGLVKRSPYRMAVPSSGRWHVVAHMQGLRGQAEVTVSTIPAESLRPLPPAREDPGLRRPRATSPLADIVANLEAETVPLSGVRSRREYDVFVSHASEDKDAVVRPLATALRDRGLTVWFDEFELRIGDSLRQRIDAGIARSRFGVVILSKAFIAKGWPGYELDGLVSMSVSGRQVLLPVWHGVTHEDVKAYSPSLAGRLARSTADWTVEEIAEEIASVVGQP